MTLELTRGERDHNPMNLEGTIAWEGAAGHDGPYCIFVDDFHGIRAGARDLYVKWSKDGLKTFNQIVLKFAPAADNNDVTAYIDHLVKATGIDADDPLELDDPAQLALVVHAFIAHENGRVIYGDDIILSACVAAIST